MFKLMLHGAVLALALSGAAPALAQQCPMGAFPSVDNFGNQVCKRPDGSTATTQRPQGQQCPNGAYPTVDNFGNQICRSMQTGNQPRTDYYDTSKGCPMGMFPSVDNFGNQVCRKP